MPHNNIYKEVKAGYELLKIEYIRNLYSNARNTNKL